MRRAFWIWAATPTVKASTRRLGQAHGHVAAADGVVHGRGDDVLDAGEVGGGEAGEGDLVVAGAAQALLHHGGDLLGRPLPHRAGDHAGLAEAAAPGAAAEDLDVEAVVDHLGEGHELLLGVGPVGEVGDGALLDDGGRGGVDRDGGLEAPVGQVAGLVEVGHVHALDAGEGRGARSARSARPPAFQAADDRVDLAHDLLAVAQHHEVEEVGERLGVVGGVAAGADQRVGGGAVGGAHGHAGQVDAVQDVRVDELGGEVEGDEVELVGRAVGVDREQRDVLAPHDLLEVGPGGVGALGEGVGALVEDLVEDLQALVGEADLVGVRVHQQPPDPLRARRRDLGAELAADVARRLLDRGEVRLEPSPDIDHGAVKGTGHPSGTRHPPWSAAGARPGMSGRSAVGEDGGDRAAADGGDPVVAVGHGHAEDQGPASGRLHRASSTGCRRRRRRGTPGARSGGNSIQATARSLAGSPAVMSPKSMTAEMPPVVDEHVAGVDVAVEPHRRAVPRGRRRAGATRPSAATGRRSRSSRSSPAAKIAARSARGTPR